jgi:crotonobetainyl-CoA:carnitine CoA-transferase CaiB-like acyl-CoA transferase
MEISSTSLPLSGIRVLELARVLAGPWAGQTLADLGAEIIKVEHADGDETRHWGPPFVKGANDENLSAAYFHATNRGKQSIIVDFTTAEGQATIRKLAQQSDVLIENFKVGSLKKYDLDPETLLALNPRLIIASISGFGQDGPRAHQPGYDFVVQGLSGFMALTGEPNGTPVKAGVAIADLFSGLHAVIGIQAALIERQRTGCGQIIDIALFDVMAAMLANHNLNYLTTGKNPRRAGNAHVNIAPYEVFPVADGHVILAVGNDSQFAKLCAILGHTEWANDPRFATNEKRVANNQALSATIAAATTLWTRQALMEACERAGVPSGPINQMSDMFADAQIVHRNMKIDVVTADGNTLPGMRTPIIMDGRKLGSAQASPRLGEHTDQILKNLTSKP